MAQDGRSRRRSAVRAGQKRGPTARGEKRRLMLLDSAETLLSQRSIPEISYADIAQHAGLPLSSCYYFYSDKFDLLRALNNRLGAALRSELEDALPSGCVDSWQALIRRSVACIAGFAERHPCAVELWCSGNMPQAIHSETKQRDKALSLVFKESFLVHFSQIGRAHV